MVKITEAYALTTSSQILASSLMVQGARQPLYPVGGGGSVLVKTDTVCDPVRL